MVSGMTEALLIVMYLWMEASLRDITEIDSLKDKTMMLRIEK